ncbi:MAG TPA: aminopeptidase, partial [Elusimicrobiales bacterium]|nr:aminopeptidase [Elusimicrobiales bacterium]
MSTKKHAKSQPKTRLEYKNINGYSVFPQKELPQLEKYCASYCEFLGKSKTERQAHDQAAALLLAAGFQDLDQLAKDGKALGPGDKVFRSCGGKTLAAFVLGRQPFENGMRLIGGHTDAPRLDVKQNPLYEESGMALMDTHYYGGIKKYQWVTIPLALHGVFVKPDG